MTRDLAASQHGVVTRSQLALAGVPLHTIDYRLKRGRLKRLHRGVYRVGPLQSQYQREMAAVLACGGGALLSYRSAAAVWGMLPNPRRKVAVDVSLPEGFRRPGESVRVHRSPGLRPDERTVVEGIPITVPARTLLDLAASVHERELEQAFAVALRDRMTTDEEITALLDRYPRRPGTRRLRIQLSGERGPAFTRSEAEARFLRLFRKAQIRGLETNVQVGGFEVDFLWRRERLIVEIDGYAFHSSSGAFERDRHRDGVLAAAGFRVIRVTWRQLTREPEALLVRVAQALARARPDRTSAPLR